MSVIARSVQRRPDPLSLNPLCVVKIDYDRLQSQPSSVNHHEHFLVVFLTMHMIVAGGYTVVRIGHRSKTKDENDRRFPRLPNEIL